MKNVLILCNNAYGLSIFRGLLISTLIKQGTTVSAVVPDSNDTGEPEARAELEHMGCRLYQIPLERRGMNPLHDIALFRAYKKLIRTLNPDLVITYTIKPNIYGGMACRATHTQYVANITGLGTAFQNDGLLKNLVVALYKYSLKSAKAVLFENEGNRQIMKELHIVSDHNSHTMPGAGVDLDKYKYTAYPAEDSPIRFLFIGRVMKEKGVDELFEAMERLCAEGYSCTLDVLGYFEENYSEKLKKYEQDGWLHYHGFQKDVRPYIANCHCFVLPSWHEGMANTNLECAAMGRPLITSNIHGCKESVIDGTSGFLCNVQDADSLYESMKKLCRLSNSQRTQLGKNGQSHVAEIFDKKKVVEKTLKIIS